MNNEIVRRQTTGRTRIAIVLLCVVIIVLGAGCGYLYWRYRQAAAKPASPAVTPAASLATKLSTFMALPSEQPGLATVLDRTKLGDPQLIAEAQNNDQLLVFAQAKRVILYRPSTGKVIDTFHVVPQSTSTPGIQPTH